MELDGLRALVTGGASGIGAAVVSHLAARGARVAVLDLDTTQAGDGELAVTFTIDELDEAITPDIARRLTSLTRLPIPGLG